MILVFSYLSSSLFLFRNLPESFGFYIGVDERCKGIHDKNGERHAFGIGTPVADDDREQSDADTIDDLSFCRHRRSDIVGGHEYGAQHQSSAQDLSKRVGIDGVGYVEQCTEHEDGSDDAQWYMPCDDSFPQHVAEADNQCQGADLTDGTCAVGNIAKQHVQ